MVETGEAREVHHLAVLLGFGCDAVCPYMVLELGNWLRSEQLLDPETTDQAVFDNYSAAMDRGISKGLNFNIMDCKCGRFRIYNYGLLQFADCSILECSWTGDG